MKTLIQFVRASGLVCALACSVVAVYAAQPNPQTPEIRQIRLGTSNVFLVKSEPHVLIDSGDKKGLERVVGRVESRRRFPLDSENITGYQLSKN